MKKFFIASAFGSVLAMASSPTWANTIYDWTLGGVDSGSGQLATDPSDNIISFIGTIDGYAVSLISVNPPGQEYTSPAGAFYYDNILYPTGNAASCAGGPSGGLLDNCGILFSFNGGEGNIWGNGTLSDYSFYDYVNGGYQITDGSVDTFSVSSVPEPGTLALLGAGLLAFAGFVGFRRRKTMI